MTAIGRFPERAAAAVAQAVLGWTAGRLDSFGREWLKAVRGEVDAIEGGWAQLAWSVGGLRLAWEFEGRRRMSDMPGKGIRMILVLFAGIVANVVARLIGVFQRDPVGRRVHPD